MDTVERSDILPEKNKLERAPCAEILHRPPDLFLDHSFDDLERDLAGLEKQRPYGRMGTGHLLFQDIQELGVGDRPLLDKKISDRTGIGRKGKQDLSVLEQKRADIVPRFHDKLSRSTFHPDQKKDVMQFEA
jgi:hypothetical protein